MKANLNRRQLLTGITAGSLLLNSSLGFASSKKDLASYIEGIIYDNFPEMLEQSEVVDQFVNDIIKNKIDLLESKSFINKESQKRDPEKFERFIVIQFATRS